MSQAKPRTLGAILYPQFELLDLYGPLEMFGCLAPDVEILPVAQCTGPVASTPVWPRHLWHRDSTWPSTESGRAGTHPRNRAAELEIKPTFDFGGVTTCALKGFVGQYPAMRH